jgi:hypothetical protein
MLMTTPDLERDSFAVLADHVPEGDCCRRCDKPWPCRPSRDARRQLVDAGVSLDAIPTIWS